jgi:chromosome segregation ATPase
MKMIKSFALPLVAAVMASGSSQLAHAEAKPPLSTVLLNVNDLAKDLKRLSDERDSAEAARAKAQAELDALGKQSGAGNKDQADAIQKRIKDADDKIAHADRILGQKKQEAQTAKKDASGKPGPNSDIAAQLEKLANERSQAEAARTKAKAELDALNKQAPKGNDKADAIRARIKEADDKIKRANATLGTTSKSYEFEAKNEDEVNQARQLPLKVTELIQKISGVNVGKNVRVEPKFDPTTKQGGFKVIWKGNP